VKISSNGPFGTAKCTILAAAFFPSSFKRPLDATMSAFHGFFQSEITRLKLKSGFNRIVDEVANYWNYDQSRNCY
jgi:hypothetical protein